MSGWEDALQERVDELRRVADDPASMPAQRQQAIVDGLALADGIGKVMRAKAKAESHAASLRALAEMGATVKAYRAWTDRPGNGEARPTQADIAAERRMGERTLTMRLRKIGIEDWHVVHAIVEVWPKG